MIKIIITMVLLTGCASSRVWVLKQNSDSGIIAYEHYDPNSDNGEKIRKLIPCSNYRMVANPIRRFNSPPTSYYVTSNSVTATDGGTLETAEYHYVCNEEKVHNTTIDQNCAQGIAAACLQVAAKYSKNGENPEKVNIILEKVCDMNSPLDGATACYDLGDEYQKKGNEKEALKYFKKSCTFSGEISTDLNAKFDGCAFYGLKTGNNDMVEKALGKMKFQCVQNNAATCYNVARIFSQRHNQSEGLKFLKLSFEAGFEDWTEIKSDQLLDDLRKSPSFEALLLEFQSKAESKNISILKNKTVEVLSTSKVSDLMYLTPEGHYYISTGYVFLDQGYSLKNNSTQKNISNNDIVTSAVLYRLSYGVYKNIMFSVGGSYAIASDQTVKYGAGSTASGESEKLQTKGLSDPLIDLKYRILEQTQDELNFDINIGASPKTINAKSATSQSSGNFGNGRDLYYVNLEMGRTVLSHDVLGSVKYSSLGAQKIEASTGDFEGDAQTKFNFGIAYRYSISERIGLLATEQYTYWSTQSSKYSSGTTVDMDSYNYNTFGLGIDIALKSKKSLFKFMYETASPQSVELKQNAIMMLEDISKSQMFSFSFLWEL